MDFDEIPAGFAMALARNGDAVNAYAVMTKDQKKAVLERARNVRSGQEMAQLVAGLAAEGKPGQ